MRFHNCGLPCKQIGMTEEDCEMCSEHWIGLTCSIPPLWTEILGCWQVCRMVILVSLWSFYACTSLSCAGIQWWKSVSFHCWTAINLVGEGRRRRRSPIPYHPTLIVSCEEFCILAFLPHSELWRVLYSCFPSSQWTVKSSAFLLSFLTVSCEEFYILACSLFTLGRCGKTSYCSAGILRPQGFSLLISSLMQAVFHSSVKSPLVREMLTIAVTSSIMCGNSCLNNEVGIGSSSHCLVGMFIMICSTSCESMGWNLSKIWISLCCGLFFGKWSRLSLISLIVVWKKSAKFSARVSK